MFTGREWIAEVGLYDYRNRVYSAELGRFIQTDPIRFDAGDVNLYRYVFNGPINLSDPLGLWGIGFYNSNLSSGFNVGVGAPSWVFTPDSAQDFGHGAQATVDGLLPFSDPFAELGEMFPGLNTYDPCEYGFSKGAGEFAYATLGLAAGLQGVKNTTGVEVTLNSYNRGGGGVNVLKNGRRVAAIDKHAFKSQQTGKMVNKIHRHTGSTKSQLKKHKGLFSGKVL